MPAQGCGGLGVREGGACVKVCMRVYVLYILCMCSGQCKYNCNLKESLIERSLPQIVKGKAFEMFLQYSHSDITLLT